MARKRQALRCAARNRRGLPCGNFSILGGTVCVKHGGGSPQARRAARDTLNTDLAGRLLASMREDCRLDGRIGPRDPSAYGCLPPSRRERYLADRHRARLMHDPLAQAAHQMIRDGFEARWSAAFRDGYSQATPLLAPLPLR
jgi:hypothetical protein